MSDEYERGLTAVKAHMDANAQSASQIADVAASIRHMVANYSNTGIERPLSCRSVPVAFDAFDGEWLVPEGADEAKRCVYLHGGGWIGGSADSHRHFADRIASSVGWPLLLINYRLAPECPYPQGLDDCAEAVRFARANGPSGAAVAEHVAVLGDSAGGNLAAALTLRAIESSGDVPDSLALLSATLDFRPYAIPARGIDDQICSEEGFVGIAGLYLAGEGSVDDRAVSPIAAPEELVSRFPPTLIQTTSTEYLRDQGVNFAKTLWDNGVPVHLSVQPCLPHVFQLFQEELGSARLASSEIAHFLATAAH